MNTMKNNESNSEMNKLGIDREFDIVEYNTTFRSIKTKEKEMSVSTRTITKTRTRDKLKYLEGQSHEQTTLDRRSTDKIASPIEHNNRSTDKVVNPVDHKDRSSRFIQIENIVKKYLNDNTFKRTDRQRALQEIQEKMNIKPQSAVQYFSDIKQIMGFRYKNRPRHRKHVNG